MVDDEFGISGFKEILQIYFQKFVEKELFQQKKVVKYFIHKF